MKITKGIAELFGALLGDGCLSKYYRKGRKNPTYCTLFTGHTHDLPYYNNTIQPLLIKYFSETGRIRKRKGMECIILICFNTKVFATLNSIGRPIGVKSNLFIPPEIFNDNKLAISCLRGIFDTDGSVYNRYSKQYANHPKYYMYKVVQIKMKEPFLIKQIGEILNRNGITTTKIGENNNAHVIRVTSQKSVEKFFSIVRPSNKYHVERYLNKSLVPEIVGPIA